MLTGSKLKEFRQSLGLSQQAAGNMLGVTKQTISNIENNRVSSTATSVTARAYEQVLIKAGRKVITLCGSMRYLNAIMNTYTRLCEEGHIVFLPGLYDFLTVPINPEPHVMTKIERHISLEQVNARQELHFSKIRMSDYVLVVNPGGYYGENTKEEIDFARKIGKNVVFLEGDPGVGVSRRV